MCCCQLGHHQQHHQRWICYLLNISHRLCHVIFQFSFKKRQLNHFGPICYQHTCTHGFLSILLLFYKLAEIDSLTGFSGTYLGNEVRLADPETPGMTCTFLQPSGTLASLLSSRRHSPTSQSRLGRFLKSAQFHQALPSRTHLFYINHRWLLVHSLVSFALQSLW